MGSQEEKVMYLTYTPATGELADETAANVEKVEKELMKRKDVDILQVSITDAKNVDPSAMMMGGGAGGALMYLIFDPDMEDFPKARDEVEDYVFNIGQSGEWKSQNFTSMSMSSNEVSYTLYSDDLDKLRDAVKQVEGALKEVDGLEDIKSDNEDPYVEHVLKVEQKCPSIRVNDSSNRDGIKFKYITRNINYRENDGKDIDVIVQRDAKAAATSLDDVLATEIKTALGTTMTIGELVDVEEGTTLNSLSRSKGEYFATVSGTIIGDDISKATTAADKN